MAVEVESGGYTVSPIHRVFSRNPLHDLESLWWVGVWLLLCHYNPSNLLDSDVQNHIPVVAKIGEKLFGLERSNRRRALVEPGFLFVHSDPEGFPTAVQHLLLAIFEFRKQLFSYYISYKPEEPQERSFFTSDVHHTCGVFFEKAIRSLIDAKDKIKLWPLDHIEAHIKSNINNTPTPNASLG